MHHDTSPGGSNPERAIVGRLAPSPTGGLHLGHARTFLVAWLAARSAGGRVVLRVEDLDSSRARDEARAGALVDLRWLGLDWNEGPDLGGPSAPYVQSERITAYTTAIDRLKRDQRVYPCTCTRADIARAASAPHAEDEGPVYPGTCSGRTVADADRLGDRPFAWRFRVPHGLVRWNDLVLGPTGIDPSGVGGDFIIARSSGQVSYQLAVVHDDSAMGVNQVIRGDDLVASTPRQILLYEALDFQGPRFGHLPLAIGSDGRRLAKREGAIKLATLRDSGVDPRRLVGLLAQSCGWADEPIPTAPRDWLDRFRFDSIPTQPWVVSPGVLDSLSD